MDNIVQGSVERPVARTIEFVEAFALPHGKPCVLMHVPFVEDTRDNL